MRKRRIDKGRMREVNGMVATSLRTHELSSHMNYMMLAWLLGCVIAALLGAALLVALSTLPVDMIDNGIFSEPTFRYIQPMIQLNHKADLQGLS